MYSVFTYIPTKHEVDTCNLSDQIIATSHDLTPKGSNHLISGKSRLVKYYDLAIFVCKEICQASKRVIWLCRHCVRKTSLPKGIWRRMNYSMVWILYSGSKPIGMSQNRGPIAILKEMIDFTMKLYQCLRPKIGKYPCVKISLLTCCFGDLTYIKHGNHRTRTNRPISGFKYIELMQSQNKSHASFTVHDIFPMLSTLVTMSTFCLRSLQNLEKTLGLFDPHSSAGYEACLKTPLPNDISLKSQAGGWRFEFLSGQGFLEKCWKSGTI